MRRWIEKLFKFKIPDEWYDENSLGYNLLHLLFWAVCFGIFLFLMTIW